MTSRLLLTACLMSSLYSQASLASGVIEETDIDTLSPSSQIALARPDINETNLDKGESFNRVPTEDIKAHFIPYVPKTALLLNRGFYWLITGYQSNEGGIQHTQRSAIVPPVFWELKLFNDQKQRITRVYTPENISPFLWFHLLRHTQKLSNAFWPYLQGTNVHIVNLGRNQIDAQGARDFAQFLQGTSVRTVFLNNNRIGDVGARDFAQSLQGTNVHAVHLTNNNRIGSVTKNFLSEDYKHIIWVF